VADRQLGMQGCRCCLQEGALAGRRALLEAVWQESSGPTQTDALYPRQRLLGSLDLDWDDVQWAANIVRSRWLGSSMPLPLFIMLCRRLRPTSCTANSLGTPFTYHTRLHLSMKIAESR
jgi:hypothetical protein